MLLVPERMQAITAEVAALIEAARFTEAARLSANLSFGRIAQLLSAARRDAVRPMLEALGTDRAAQTLAEMPIEFVAELLDEAGADTASAWLAAMPVDVAVDVLGYLPEPLADAAMARLPEETRAAVRRLARYPEGTAGAVMSPYFSAVPLGKTVAEVIDTIRAAPTRLTRTGYVYVLDGERRLQGVASLRDLMISAPATPVERVMKRDIVAARVDDNASEAARRIRSRRLKMLPVVDQADALLGVIYMEDALQLLSYELAEDLAGIGAGSPDESFFTPPRRAIRMRLPWMGANVFLNLGAVAVIASFESTIAQVAILAAFLPMITDMGGNVGIQALSVSIRSIALGEVLIRDYWRAARKEVAIGLCNGLVLGLLFGIIAYLLEGNPILGAVAGAALGVNVLVAGVVGGTIPFLIKRLGRDPAMMTGPILTTITDITGVTIYLGLATLFLAGLLG